MKKRILVYSSFLLLILWGSKDLWLNETSPIPGLTADQIKAVFDTASGDRALNDIRHLVLHHRWFVSDGYHEAAEYVQQKAREIGLADIGIEKFPADGEIYYSTEKSIPKWTVRSAELNLLSPIRKRLVSWEENPITLASYSRSAHDTTELVDVGEGTSPDDYTGKDVKGKLVLASCPQAGGRIELAHKLAVLERGAAGVISYRSYYLDDFPDLIAWDHIWTHELDGRQSTYGFCVSKRMGRELRRLLLEGKEVVLQAKVDADISPGHFEVVTGSIPGTDLSDQEIWFIAHLDHCLPSANDNASGSAAILETARTLTRLIEKGSLPRPRRTIRFFWVPEISGTYAYIAHHLENTGRAVAVINMDMVGENQEICGSTFRITKTPGSTPSFFNDLLDQFLEFMKSHPPRTNREMTDPLSSTSFMGTREPWRAEIIPYSGGSDHYVFMGGVINVPATMFGSSPDYFYHSSGDTSDKADPTQLKRAVILGTLAAASLANLNTESVGRLLDTIFAMSLQRADKALAKAMEMLESSRLRGDDLEEALNVPRWFLQKEMRTLKSVLSLLPGDKRIEAAVDHLLKELKNRSGRTQSFLEARFADLCRDRGIRPGLSQVSEEDRQAGKIKPVRKPEFFGPISSEYVAANLQATGQVFESRLTGLQRFLTGALMDGRRSILEIRNAVSAETAPVAILDMMEYIQILETCGLVVLER